MSNFLFLVEIKDQQSKYISKKFPFRPVYEMALPFESPLPFESRLPLGAHCQKETAGNGDAIKERE